MPLVVYEHTSMEDYRRCYARPVSENNDTFKNIGYATASSYYNAFGDKYMAEGEHGAALEYFIGLLDVSKSNFGDNAAHPIIAVIYSKIGDAYKGLGYYQKALTYYIKSRDMMVDINWRGTTIASRTSLHSNIGSVYKELKEYTVALQHYTTAFGLLTNYLGMDAIHLGIASLCRDIGAVHSETGQFGMALLYLIKAKNVYKAIYGEYAFHPDITAIYNSIAAVHNMAEKHMEQQKPKRPLLQIKGTVWDQKPYSLQEIGMKLQQHEAQQRPQQPFQLPYQHHQNELQLEQLQLVQHGEQQKGQQQSREQQQGPMNGHQNGIDLEEASFWHFSEQCRELSMPKKSLTSTKETKSFQQLLSTPEIRVIQQEPHHLQQQTAERPQPQLQHQHQQDQQSLQHQHQQDQQSPQLQIVQHHQQQKGQNRWSQDQLEQQQFPVNGQHDGTDMKGASPSRVSGGSDHGNDEDDKYNEHENGDEESMNSLDSDTEFKPIPSALVEKISRLCKEKSATSIVFIQSPVNWRKILVMGVNAENIQEQLEKEVKEEFVEFCVVTQNTEGPLSSRQLTHLLTIAQKSPKSINSCEWHVDKSATCELFVIADAKNKDRPTHEGAIYAVGPAHLVLSDEQNKRGASASSNVDHIRQEVEKMTTSRRYISTLYTGDQEEVIDLCHPPLLSYRHWFQDSQGLPIGHADCKFSDETDLCPHMFMNDIALFHVDPSTTEHLQEKLGSTRSSRDLYGISSTTDLQELHNKRKRVTVKNFAGKIGAPIPMLSYDGHVGESFGKYLPFQLLNDSNQLIAGDCGSIVYCEDEDGKTLPLGMFIGKFELSEGNAAFFGNVYQAIILCQALKDVEQDYPHHVDNIRIFHLPAEPLVTDTRRRCKQRKITSGNEAPNT